MGKKRGLAPTAPCALDERPTDKEANDRCPGAEPGVHEHVVVRGSVKVPGKRWRSRAALTAYYTLVFGLEIVFLYKNG